MNKTNVNDRVIEAGAIFRLADLVAGAVRESSLIVRAVGVQGMHR